MISRLRCSWCLCLPLMVLSATLGLMAPPASADTGHARIIRLSLVQGDVRFTRDTHGDPLTDSKNLWENATLNLPIREGYVLATDHGRAVVEFENGAMALLNEDTVIEFYDLSIENGARTTRLILRQGAASFYVNSGNGEYFSVTGGDFTAEATTHATFRLDNFDDGSNLNVTAGHVSVIRKDHTTAVGKGESFSITAANGHVSIGSPPQGDDFDRWVSARIESAVAASNAGLQYASNSYYTSGFGDLYTYGSWFPVSGYGYGWQPFGAGLGWSPFSYGGWFMDSAFGWGFIGNQPWGWLPYHFGGWAFEPGIGWVWLPGNLGYGGYTAWRPATVTWVHLKSGPLGVVPAHLLDVPGKTSANLVHGVYPVSNGVVSAATVQNSGEWKIEKTPPRNAFSNALSASARPELVSRTMPSGGTGERIASVGRNSGIIYDAETRRFVNAGSPGARSGASNELLRTSEAERTSAGAVASRRANAGSELSAARRTQSVAPRAALTPPPSPAQRSAAASGGWVGGSSSSSGVGRASGSTTSSPARSSSGTSTGSSGGRSH